MSEELKALSYIIETIINNKGSLADVKKELQVIEKSLQELDELKKTLKGKTLTVGKFTALTEECDLVLMISGTDEIVDYTKETSNAEIAMIYPEKDKFIIYISEDSYKEVNSNE